MVGIRPVRTLVPLRLILLSAILLASVGCTILPTVREEELTPTPVPAPPIPQRPSYTVQRGVVEQTLSFSGRVGPSVESELFFRQAGRVARVYVQNGDVVELGQTLAELDNAELDQRIAQAQLELDAAQSALQAAQENMVYTLRRAEIALEIQRLNLAKLESQNDRADVTVALANLQAAEAERKAAQRAYDERAGQPGAEASGQALALERATLNHTVVQASYDKALAAVAQRELDLEIERKRLELAELEVAHLAKEVDPGLTHAVAQAALSLEQHQGLIDATVITATIAGRVTSIGVHEGRTVDAYKPVIVVSDDSELEISADPSSAQKAQLTEGMAVTVSLPAFPGEMFAGEIVSLPYPYGTGGGSSVEDPDTRTHVRLTGAAPSLQAGDLVRVLVTLERRDDVLWLPPAAIQRYSGRRFVLVEEDGRQRSVDVRVGIESAERVEILEGLEEGQIVVGQ